MSTTTCPLDCFDGCSIYLEDGKLKGEKAHPITQGYLCPHMNNFHKIKRIEQPTLNGEEISMEKVVDILAEQLKETLPSKTLFFKGSGNLGCLQSITREFFAKHDAKIAKGSLCEDAGSYGIVEGRGASLVLSPTQVAKSEVVILWGRNPTTTNSHMLKALKDKTIIVIDPIKTDLAKSADLHVNIRPRSDIYLAMLLSRVAYMEEMEDEDFIEKRCENFKYFRDMVLGIPMMNLIKRSGVSLNNIADILALIKDKKVSILVGLGVQKYTFGHSVLRAIDSFAAMLGLFGKVGCGVGYIDDSAFGFKSHFSVKKNKVKLPTVDFGAYDLVFVQGGNPMSQMPCTPKVKEGFEKAKFIVYFGLYENATSKMANLIIPAKTFLEKDDLKLSYGHEFIGAMPKLIDSDIGISEYELSKKLHKIFGFENLKSEKEYIDEIVQSNSVQKGDKLISKTYETIPYEKEFYTDSGKFEFFDEFYDEVEDEDIDNGYFLLSAKNLRSLNSQFKTRDSLHVPLSLNLKDGDKIILSNGKYECEYEVKNDDRLRNDCFLLYSGGNKLNMLTPHSISEEGDCAIFQEVKVFIKDER